MERNIGKDQQADKEMTPQRAHRQGLGKNDHVGADDNEKPAKEKKGPFERVFEWVK